MLDHYLMSWSKICGEPLSYDLSSGDIPLNLEFESKKDIKKEKMSLTHGVEEW